MSVSLTCSTSCVWRAEAPAYEVPTKPPPETITLRWCLSLPLYSLVGSYISWRSLLQSERNNNVHILPTSVNTSKSTIPNSVRSWQTRKLLDRRDREWCLCHVSKSIFALVWPWSFTSWHTKSIISCLCPRNTCANLHQTRFNHFQNIVFTSFAMNEQDQRKGRTDH